MRRLKCAAMESYGNGILRRWNPAAMESCGDEIVRKWNPCGNAEQTAGEFPNDSAAETKKAKTAQKTSGNHRGPEKK